jgi:hypothetical protein
MAKARAPPARRFAVELKTQPWGAPGRSTSTRKKASSLAASTRPLRLDAGLVMQHLDAAMTDRFLAINVGYGDAFFLQRQAFSVLVDGGKSRDFPARLDAAGVCHPMLVVCTHNDNDHTNGLYDYFDTGGSASALWLPATWLEAVKRLSEAERDEIESLFDDSQPGIPDKADRIDGDVIEADYVEDLLTDGVPFPAFGNYAHIHRRRLISGPTNVVAITQHHKWLQAADNIWSVASAAARRGIRLVWFDPEVAPNVAPTAPISVLNATPVSSIRRSRAKLKQVLALTMVNRMSLVLYSPPDANAPGALFCADSDFHNICTPPSDVGMIVTAPHHGSTDKGNCSVYANVSTAGASHNPSSWSWVRSDKDYSKRPTEEYLQQTQRYCTQCRGRSLEQMPQTIEFVGGGGQWRTSARACNCLAKAP